MCPQQPGNSSPQSAVGSWQERGQAPSAAWLPVFCARCKGTDCLHANNIVVVIVIDFFHTHHLLCHVVVWLRLLLLLHLAVVIFSIDYYEIKCLQNNLLSSFCAACLSICPSVSVSFNPGVRPSARASVCHSFTVFGAVNHSSNAVSPCCSYCCYCRPIINIAAIVIFAVVAAVAAVVLLLPLLFHCIQIFVSCHFVTPE